MCAGLLAAVIPKIVEQRPAANARQTWVMSASQKSWPVCPRSTIRLSTSKPVLSMACAAAVTGPRP
eukprot:8982140-Pyramimonas_sp.AAC.1